MDSHDLLTIGEVSHRNGGPPVLRARIAGWNRSGTGLRCPSGAGAHHAAGCGRQPRRRLGDHQGGCPPALPHEG